MRGQDSPLQHASLDHDKEGTSKAAAQKNQRPGSGQRKATSLEAKKKQSVFGSVRTSRNETHGH